MKTKDLFTKLNDELDEVIPKTLPSAVTDTPISVKRNEERAKATAKSSGKSFFKTRGFQALCACLVCVAVLVGVIVPVVLNSGGNLPGDGNVVPTPPIVNADASATYLSLEINPSVDYVVDKKGVVRNVISKNNDGDVLLSHGFKDELIGKNIDVAVTNTIDRATALGYIDAKATATKPSAMRISIAGDNDKSVKAVLDGVKAKATEHLKDSGIYMVVVGREVDKSLILGNSGINSIEKWNEVNKDKDSFHYINSVVGMDKDEIVEQFKSEFISHYIADAFDEMFEDMEDIISLIGSIEELEQDLKEAEDEAGVIINKDYWYYLRKIKAGNDSDIDSGVLEVIEEITEKFDEYNEIIEDSDNDGDIIDLSNVFKKIDDNELYYDFLKHKVKVLPIEKIREDVEDIIDKIEDDINNVSVLLDKLNGIFGAIFDGVEEITSNIKVKIDEEISKITGKAEEYYRLCTDNINSAYDRLIKRNENNKGSGIISDDEYEDFVENILSKFEDEDDFWESTHTRK